MKSDNLDEILELRESDNADNEDAPKRSRKWRFVLMLILVSVLIVSLAPMGIMVLLHQGDNGLGEREIAAFIVFRTLSVLIGIYAIGSSNPNFFKYVFWTFLVLAILNVSGCAMILYDLGGI